MDNQEQPFKTYQDVVSKFVDDVRLDCDHSVQKTSNLYHEHKWAVCSLAEMIHLHCTTADGSLSSKELPENAEALRVLSRLGLLTLTYDGGSIVTAEWRQKSGQT